MQKTVHFTFLIKKLYFYNNNNNGCYNSFYNHNGASSNCKKRCFFQTYLACHSTTWYNYQYYTPSNNLLMTNTHKSLNYYKKNLKAFAESISPSICTQERNNRNLCDIQDRKHS